MLQCSTCRQQVFKRASEPNSWLFALSLLSAAMSQGAADKEVSDAGGQTPEPHGVKRPSEHLGQGARRILARTCTGDIQEFCLADFLPEEWLTPRSGGRTPVFDAQSIAHHKVRSEDLEARSSIMVSQFLARDVLNQALMTLGVLFARFVALGDCFSIGAFSDH